MKTITLTEAEVRAMRDQVYETQSTDRNWAGCREHWMKPDAIEWLIRRREVKLIHTTMSPIDL